MKGPPGPSLHSSPPLIPFSETHGPEHMVHPSSTILMANKPPTTSPLSPDSAEHCNTYSNSCPPTLLMTPKPSNPIPLSPSPPNPTPSPRSPINPLFPPYLPGSSADELLPIFFPRGGSNCSLMEGLSRNRGRDGPWGRRTCPAVLRKVRYLDTSTSYHVPIPHLKYGQCILEM